MMSRMRTVKLSAHNPCWGPKLEAKLREIGYKAVKKINPNSFELNVFVDEIQIIREALNGYIITMETT